MTFPRPIRGTAKEMKAREKQECFVLSEPPSALDNHHKVSFALVAAVMMAAVGEAFSQAFYMDYLISSSK